MSLDWSALLGLAGVLVGAGVSYLATRQAAERTFDAAQLTITANTTTAEQDRKDAADREYRANKRARYDNLASDLADLTVSLAGFTTTVYRSADDEIQSQMIGLMTQANSIHRQYAVFSDEALRTALRFISTIMGLTSAPLNGYDRKSYVALSRYENLFKWGNSNGLERADKATAAIGNISVVRTCVDWCINHISYEMGYNSNPPEDIKFEFAGTSLDTQA